MRSGIRMAKLSIVLQPDNEDWVIMERSCGSPWDPATLDGIAIIRIGKISLRELPSASAYLDGDGISVVPLGWFIPNLLEGGFRALRRKRGRIEVAIDGTDLIFRLGPKDQHTLRVDVLSGRSGPPCLTDEVSKKEFAVALKDAVAPLLERVRRTKPELLKTLFWTEVDRMLGEIMRWYESSHQSQGYWRC